MSCGKSFQQNINTFNFNKSGNNINNIKDKYTDAYLYTAYLGRVKVRVLKTDNPDYILLESNAGKNDDITTRVIDYQFNRINLQSNTGLNQLGYYMPVLVSISQNKETYFEIQKQELQNALLSNNTNSYEKHQSYLKKFELMEPLLYTELNKKFHNMSFDKEYLHSLYVKNSCIDIHFNTNEFLKFLQDKLRIDSINDKKLVLSIYNVPMLDNAFFNGEYMIYGNGNTMFYPLTSIDVSAHELTHGLVQHTAGLEYIGHSGALNESFSDMIGTAFELHLYEKYNSDADSNNDINGEGDWLCGEDIGKQIKYIRNLQNPNKAEIPQPATYRGKYWANPNNERMDHGGVHINSGITNRLFFLLTEALNLNISIQIVYNCLLKLKRNSDFIDFRNILLQCTPDDNKSIVTKCLNDVGLDDNAVSDWNRSPKRNRIPKKINNNTKPRKIIIRSRRFRNR